MKSGTLPSWNTLGPLQACNGIALPFLLQFSIVSIILPMLPHSYSSTRCCYQKDKRAKFGNLQKSNSLSEIGELWIQKEFRVVFHLSPQRTKHSACVRKQSYVTEDNKGLARNK